MAYAVAQMNTRPWSSGFLTIRPSSRYLCASLKLYKFRSHIVYSSVGKLTRASFQRVEEEEDKEEEDDDDEDEFQVLTAITSNYNDIVIVDSPKYRVLLLDSPSTTARVLPYLHLSSSEREFRPSELCPIVDLTQVMFTALFTSSRCGQVLTGSVNSVSSRLPQFAHFSALLASAIYINTSLPGGCVCS